MFQISTKYKLNEIENAIEQLQIVDIYNVYYEVPIEVTTTEYGYDYFEKNEEMVDLKVIVESDDENECNRISDIIKNTLNISDLQIKKLESINYNNSFEVIDLNNGWIIADPNYTEENKNKINFIHQGAFGTGLHETTQDCLRYILKEDFSNKNVLDIGTGSGILSIAASIKGAFTVTALDIRDVKDEIDFNASLNSVNNIDVVVGDVISGETKLSEKYDYVFINIGGEETQMFMKFINSIIKPNGKLLISGLVEWSFDKVIDFVKDSQYEFLEKTNTNEWCSAILKKNNL